MVALAVLAPIVASWRQCRDPNHDGGGAGAGDSASSSNNAFRVVMREAGRPRRGLACRHHRRRRGVWFKIPGLGVVIGMAIICNLVAARSASLVWCWAGEGDPVASGTFAGHRVVGFSCSSASPLVGRYKSIAFSSKACLALRGWVPVREETVKKVLSSSRPPTGIVMMRAKANMLRLSGRTDRRTA